MSLRQVIEEQLERSQKSISAYKKKIEEMPKGSLHKKERGKKAYYYLKYRDDDGKRVDKYIKASDVTNIKRQISKRREYEKMVKELEEDIQIAKKALR